MLTFIEALRQTTLSIIACVLFAFSHFFSSLTYLFLYNTAFIFHLKDVCSQQGYVLKKGKEWYTYFWNPIFCSLRKCRAEKFKKPSILSDIVRIFLLHNSPNSQDNRVIISKKKIWSFTALCTFFLYNYSTDLQFLMYT